MGNKGLFPGVAVPRAFFGTFFRFERKYYPSRGGSPTIRAGVGASIPRQGSRIMRQSGAFHASRPLGAAALPCPPGQWVCACGRTKGLSSGQTIGAVRTAVRSACCLPELRVANRLRRLYPLDDGELFKFNLKSSVCQRQTGLPKGNPPCAFPTVPAKVLGRREGAGIQWMQLPKAVSD